MLALYFFEHFIISRGSHAEVLCKKGAFRNFTKFTGKHLCRVSFSINLQVEACNFIKKEALTQVFSYEFCKIFKNIFFYRTPPVAASVHCCLWISHSVFCSVSHRRSFYCHYRHEQSHCVHLKVIQVGGFLLHLSLLKYFLSRANWSLTELIFPS